MKILLINPPLRESRCIPIGLGMIASVLRQDGHEVSVMDIQLEALDAAKVSSELERRVYDAVGIGGLSPTFKYSKRLMAEIKKLRPAVKIVVGNMLATAAPGTLMERTLADVAVIDEGELTAVELFRVLERGGDLSAVKGIWYRENGKVLSTPKRERIKDLDGLPFPAWDLFPMDCFIKQGASAEGGTINISTSRGCPYDCDFCSRSFGRTVYFRSPENIIAELKELKRRYPWLRHFVTSDDLFMTDKNRVRNFCDLLIREDLGLTWRASARVNLIDEAICRKMRSAGCVDIALGLESGSPRILQAMNKGFTVEAAERALEILHKAGFVRKGTFMIGYPGETRESIEETLAFIRRTKQPPRKFFYATPYPGTKLYTIAKQMGKIPEDEETFLSSLMEMSENMAVNFTEFSDEELRRLKKWAEHQTARNAPLEMRFWAWKARMLTRWQALRRRGWRLIYDKLMRMAGKPAVCSKT
jgi:radical SAM superfamily enzyme YgiQ (UPF0313 family)